MQRTLPWDWYAGTIPANVEIDDSAYLETTYGFLHYHSEAQVGVRLGPGASAYIGTVFDVGTRGQVSLGAYTLAVGVRIICDAEVTVGDYTLMSWNVVLMDSYRLSRDPVIRRGELERLARSHPRRLEAQGPARPIHIGANVWLGFEVCVLPGVTVGDGAIVGARSVVMEDVAPYTVVAGNPARIIRYLEPKEVSNGG
jgi:hypothetical protein